MPIDFQERLGKGHFAWDRDGDVDGCKCISLVLDLKVWDKFVVFDFPMISLQRKVLFEVVKVCCRACSHFFG